MPQIITVSYKDKEYTINEVEVLEVCDAVEDFVTLGELAEMLSHPKRIKFGKLASAYASMLRAIGAPATKSEIHQEFRASLGSGSDGVKNAQEVLSSLTNILMDGSSQGGGEGDKKPGNESD